jgi:hypothetical protein
MIVQMTIFAIYLHVLNNIPIYRFPLLLGRIHRDNLHSDTSRVIHKPTNRLSFYRLPISPYKLSLSVGSRIPGLYLYV